MNERKLTEYLDSLLKAGLPSFDCMVSKDHELLYRRMGGFADAGKTEPIRADQKYLMFSMTKIQTMTPGSGYCRGTPALLYHRDSSVARRDECTHHGLCDGTGHLLL